MKARIAGLILALALVWTTCAPVRAQDTAVLLADPADPYYGLAREMAAAEAMPLVHSLDEALRRDPVYLLWVVSPARLSDQALVNFTQAMGARDTAISAGIITGSSLERARALWQRAADVRGERVYAVNAANPAGHIEAGILWPDGDGLPLTKAGFLASLASADYLTFTGHGSPSALYLQEGVALRAADLPDLGPVVVATGSCNTFRPWEQDSLALAFADRGAAAYAGFAYSPNEGYLLGEFEGLPLRYTWPEFPIGHAIQVQNRGVLAGFASFPYYLLLGDPRLALQAEAPYRLIEDRMEGESRVQRYSGAPAGIIPVRLPGGSRYSFVEVEAVTAGWQGEPFYNARLQMADVGPDKFLLFEHPGGDFTLRLRVHPSPAWVVGDVVLDSLDNTLLYLQDHGGALVILAGGCLALPAVLFRLVRRRGSASRRGLALAGLLGLAAAVLHALYGLARLDAVTITSKEVGFGVLSPASTFLLVTCAGFLFAQARSRWGRAGALALATLPALAPAVLLLTVVAVADDLLVGSRLGTGLWNCRMGLQPLAALPVLGLPLVGGLAWLRRMAGGEPLADELAHPARQSGPGEGARRDAPVLAAQVLFALNAATWALFGVVGLDRLGPADADGNGVAVVVTALVFGNAAAMAWLAWAVGRRRAVWYIAAVVVAAMNTLLSATDQFGLLDLLVLLGNGALLLLLIAARSRFLAVSRHKTDGEAMNREKRRSF